MRYLKISNTIEIEDNAFHLLGACTKHDSSDKIGYFGSGLKYAMAVLLRNNIAFEIWSGLKNISITCHKETLRKQSFNVISVNNVKTSLTTAMGPDWKVWQAIREVYCNSLDEPNSQITQVNEIVPVENETSFYFDLDSNDELRQIISQWDEYFADNRKSITPTGPTKAYEPITDNMILYRKGIRCFEDKYNSLYDYDFSAIEINESRLISSDWETKHKIAHLWRSCVTEPMIEKLIKLYQIGELDNQYFEEYLIWPSFSFSPYSSVWKEVLKDKILVPHRQAGNYEALLSKPNHVILPNTLITALIKQFPDDLKACYLKYDTEYKCIYTKFTKKQTFLIKEALAFFKEVDIKIGYPIVVGDFEDARTLGEAINNQIVLSNKLFDKGKKKLVSVIIEEHMHLDSEFSDETRDFQDYIINQMITMLENQHGIFL